MLNFDGLTDEEIKNVHKLLNVKPKKLTPTVRSYLKKHKVYISMTSSPLRLRKLPIVLNILDLGEVSEIHVNLPKLYRNKEMYKKEDIEFVEKTDNRIKIHRVPKDLGPLTKIIPTLQRVKDPKAIIISVDDDIGYPYNLISSLIYYSVTKPNNIYCGAGFDFGGYPGSDFDRSLWPRKKAPTEPQIDIVEGWGGIAYKKSVVTAKMISEILKLNQVSTTCKLSDDFTISYVLADHNIKCVEIDGIRDYLESFSYGFDADALNQGSGVEKSGAEDENMVKYHKCLADIDTNKSKRIKRKSRTRIVD